MPQRALDDFEGADVSCLELVLLTEGLPASRKTIIRPVGAWMVVDTFHLPRLVPLHGLERDLATLQESEACWKMKISFKRESVDLLP